MASSGGKPPEPPSVGGYFTTMFGLPAKGQAPATASTAGVKAADTNPEDIPKEDLLHLCMKMNKRMQALEAKGAEMNKKCKDLGTEKRQLLDIIKSYVNGDVSTDADALDMVVLREKVSRQSALTKDAIKSLEDRLTLSERAHAKELAALELKMHKELSLQASKVANASHINPSDGSVENGGMSSIQNDYFAMEIERLAAENEAMSSLKEDLQSKLVNCDSEIAANREKVEQLVREVSQLELVAREKATHLDEFMKESDREKMKAEERILYLQMQLNALKSKEEGKDKEITVLKAENEEQTASILALQNQVKDGEININDYKEVIRDLHSKVSDFEEEMSRLKGKGHELEKNSAYTTVLKAEQEAIVSTLRKDLKIAISGREESVRRCRELEEYRVKAEAKLGQLSEMIQAVDEARDALEEREARITRLQSEATTAERNHAIRTAMLATAESHIESLKSDIESRDKSLREVSQRCEALQAQIDEADGRMTKAVDDLKVELHRAIATLKEDSIAHTMELASIKEKHAEELDHIKRDYTKKSTAARVMMSEKDAEIKTLTALVAELKDEIASGAHNERRIFELAKSQSQREATHNLHSDTRELAFQQLQHTLATRDLELAKLQSSQANLLQENTDLRRVSRREGVNMDYLKNVVVQYMSLPTSSAERNALVPVIAMLLQLNSAELATVQAALKAPLWASLPVKAVKPRSDRIGNSSSGKSLSASSNGKSKSSSPANRIETSSSMFRPGHYPQAVSTTPISSPSGNSAYAPPSIPIAEANNQHRHPMLDRSDTSDDNIVMDLGAEDTPEIHM